MNEQLKASYEQILSNLGEDVNRPGLKDTPARAAKAMVSHRSLGDGRKRGA